jgi:hypothetical protein
VSSRRSSGGSAAGCSGRPACTRDGELVNGAYFDVLGMQVVKGRTFSASETPPDAGSSSSRSGWRGGCFLRAAAWGVGIRMALGATSRRVAHLVLSQSLRAVAIGVIGGAVLAGGLGRALLSAITAANIGTIDVYDPVAYAAGIVAIIGACVLAASVPARRAARIDPMTTLKQE